MIIENQRLNYDNFSSKIKIVRMFFERKHNIINKETINYAKKALPESIVVPFLNEVDAATNEIKNLLDTSNSPFTRNSIKKDWSDIHDWLKVVFETNKLLFENVDSKESNAFDEMQMVCFNFYRPIIEMINLSEGNISLEELSNKNDSELPMLGNLRQIALYAYFNNEKIKVGNQDTFAKRHGVSNKAQKLYKEHFALIESGVKSIYQHKQAKTDLEAILQYFTDESIREKIKSNITSYSNWILNNRV